MGIIGKTLRFVAGLGVGAGIGAVTALLLAPQSGETSQEQVQARLQEILDAGRRAAHKRENELYTAWEATVNEGQHDDGKDKAQSQDATDKEREKARIAAHRHDDQARDEAQKQLEKATEEAQKHLEKARAELDKAESAK